MNSFSAEGGVFYWGTAVLTIIKNFSDLYMSIIFRFADVFKIRDAISCKWFYKRLAIELLLANPGKLIQNFSFSGHRPDRITRKLINVWRTFPVIRSMSRPGFRKILFCKCFVLDGVSSKSSFPAHLPIRVKGFWWFLKTFWWFLLSIKI